MTPLPTPQSVLSGPAALSITLKYTDVRAYQQAMNMLVSATFGGGVLEYSPPECGHKLPSEACELCKPAITLEEVC